MRQGSGDLLLKAGVTAITVALFCVCFVVPAMTQTQASSVSLALSQNPAPYGTDVTFSGTVTGSSGTIPTGTVTLYDGGSSIGSASLAADGSATLDSASLAIGTHALSVAYSGDGTYLSSTSSTVTLTITQASPVLSLSSSANPSMAGGVVQFTVSLANGSTGSVSVQDGQTVLQAVSVPALAAGCKPSGGIFSFTMCQTWTFMVSAPSLTAGQHQITASYSGDSNFNSATVSVTQTVSGTASTPTVVVTPPISQVAFDGTVTVTATVSTASSGGQPVPDTTAVGTMTFTSDVDGDLAVVPVVQGSATFTTSSLSVGTSTMSAEYSGDGSHTTAQGSAALSVVEATPTIVLGASLNPGTDAYSYTLTATMPLDATGMVTFLDGSTVLGTGYVNVGPQCDNTVGCNSTSAWASIITELIPSSHNLIATYPGDGNYNSATSNAVDLTIGTVAPGTGVAPAITWAQPSPITYGTVLDSTELNAIFSVSGSCVYSPVAGVTLPAGTQTLSVTCTPTDTTDYSVLSDTVILAVNQAIPTITVSSSANPSTLNQSVTFTATLPSDATGTVQFQIDGSDVGDSASLSSGTASYATTALSTGSHSVSAVYSGDQNYLANSSTLAQMVIPPVSTSPLISSIYPTFGIVGTLTTILGSNFGVTQSSSTVTFNGLQASPSSWSDTQIVVAVPGGAASGDIVTTVSGVASNGVAFAIQPPLLQMQVSDSVAAVTLSDAENLDWVIWGADGSTPSATRSSTELISNYTVLGGASVSTYNNGIIQFAWSGGTPIASGSGVTPYINVYGLNAGFQITASADTTIKTLKLYASSCDSLQISAALSDGSSPAISSNTVTSSCQETYSIDYRASSAGQILTVQISSTAADQGVSISAAVLQPHLPQVVIVSPQDQQSYNYGTAIPIQVTSTQYDYNVVSTTLSANGTQISYSGGYALAAIWATAPQGHYQLQAAAVDSHGLSGTAKAISVDVIGTGGGLSESFSSIATSVDLTTEGTADWIAFAEANWDYTVGSHKAGVHQLISSPAIIGLNEGSGTYFLSGGLFSFEDGTPDVQENNITPMAYVSGPPQTGFELSVKADTTSRTLRLYCSASAPAQLRAYLSDGSSPVVVDTSLQDNNAQYVFTINFNAASAGQNLIIDLVAVNGGGIFLNAATLTGASLPLPPQITAVQPTAGVPGDPVTISGVAFGTQPGSITFNGITAIVASWTQTSIIAYVPVGTGTGPVVVTTDQGASNNDQIFAVRSSIYTVVPSSGVIGTPVTLTGIGFGLTGLVSFNGAIASISSWSDSQIVAVVPTGATTGPVVVTQGGITSNPAAFMVQSATQAAPLLKLRINDTPAAVNLSDATNTDWALWGADGQTTAATRMAGANLISDPLNGATASSLAYTCRPVFSWSGGTPISSGASVTGCISITSPSGGPSLAVPAGVTAQTLKVYVQGWGPIVAVAYLSDGSAETIVDTSVSGPSYVGEEKTYSFDYRAASGEQQLTVIVIGSVLLEGAILQPHLPEVTLLEPADGTSFNANSNVIVGIDTLQFDNQVTAATLLANQSQTLSFSSAPYTGVWPAPGGHYQVQASAPDSAGLSGTSGIHEVDIIGNGGELVGSVSKLTVSNTISTDLTTEGTADWILFAPPYEWSGSNGTGSYTGIIRKIGVAPFISTAKPLGQGDFYTSINNTGELFQFEDGTPDPSDSGIMFDMNAAGAGSGFEITVVADTSERIFRLHTAISNGTARLQAFLSDGSAPVWVDRTLSPQNGWYSQGAVYSIKYHAASAGQTLTVRYFVDGTPSSTDSWRSVQIYAASVDGVPITATPTDPIAPTISITSPNQEYVSSSQSIAITGTVSDASSGVAWLWCGSGLNFANIQNGTFSCAVNLHGASNSVEIEAGNNVGDIASTALSVSFIPAIGLSPTGKLITPDQLSMLVGDTHNMRRVGTTDTIQGDCDWYSSNTSVATVSITDCINATISAVSPGTAEIISADAGATITVYDGTSLPTGSIQWSIPATQSTINEITPQPPYTPTEGTALASYAREGTYYVTALAADGTQLWEHQMLSGGWDPSLYTHPLVPDFQGRVALPYPNLIGGTAAEMSQNPQGLVVYDATTGTGGSANVYTYQNGALQYFGPGFNQYDPQAAMIPSPDGTYYVADPPNVKGLDSLTYETVGGISTGRFVVKFVAAIAGCSGGQNVHTGRMILAGDGALYVPFGDYTISTGTDSNGSSITTYPCNRIGVARVTSDGTLNEMTLLDFPSTALYSAQALINLSMISNADQGAFIAFSDYSTAGSSNGSNTYPTAYLATVSSSGNSLAALSHDLASSRGRKHCREHVSTHHLPRRIG